MEFKKADIIAKIDACIAAAEAANEETTQKQIDKRSKMFRAWRTQELPRFVALADFIQDRITSTGVITDEDVKKWAAGSRNLKADWNFGYDRYFGDLYLTPWTAGDRPVLGLKDTSELKALKAMLEAVTDETVTTSGLTRAGFRDISFLFRS